MTMKSDVDYKIVVRKSTNSVVIHFSFRNYGWDYVSILFSPETYGTDGAELIRKLLNQEGTFLFRFQVF